MKEPAASPFAALSSKEQMERWACWHSQHMEEKPTAADVKSESVAESTKPTASLKIPKPHHSQYDAVIRRIKNAQRRTLAYTSCSSVESTRQF